MTPLVVFTAFQVTTVTCERGRTRVVLERPMLRCVVPDKVIIYRSLSPIVDYQISSQLHSGSAEWWSRDCRNAGNRSVINFELNLIWEV